MHIHQHAKGELNQFRDGAVIDTDAHIHSPLKTYIFLLFTFIYIYMGQTKIPKLTDIIIIPYAHF